MSRYDDIADRYLAAWNTTDDEERLRAVAALYADDAVYTDPMAVVRGHDEISGLIGAVQAQFPGSVLVLAGRVDGHHDQLRFGWELGPVGRPAPVAGFDAVVLDRDGRIATVLGFLDRVPVA